MISKDRVTEEVDDDNQVSTPDKSEQVTSEIETNACNMLNSSTVVRSIPGDGNSHRVREGVKDSHDNVQNLLGRSFNGDLIASQVYLCISCGVELEDAESLRQHELNCVSVDNSRHLHTPNMVLEEGEGFRKLVCEICRAYFSETDHLQEHKLLHLNTSNVCYLCDTFFANRYLLARHVVCQHSERFGVKQNEEGVHEPYTCAICILRFSTLISLQAHEDSHGVTEKTPTCRVCSVCNASHQALQSHLKSSLHAEMKLQLQNLFTCIDCSTVFHCRDAYAMHMMMRAKDESCKKKPRVIIAKPDALTNSNVVMIKEEPVDPTSPECPDTPSQFPRHPEGSSLAGCPMSESPGTTHVCPACGMLCCDSNHLLMHLRMCGSVLSPQTNDTWVQSQNGLVFKWAVNKTYSLHLPGSMSRKEKKCSYCHKSFLDQDDLAMHVMSDHTGDTNESERTISPLAPNIWRSADMNGSCPLPTYSPSALVAFDPNVSQHIVSSSNKLTEHQFESKHHTPNLSRPTKDFRSSQTSEVNAASRTSVATSTNQNVSLNRKRRHGRSHSTVFRSNHQPENRSKSADIAVNSTESEAKHPRLSTPPARCSGRVGAYSPLDLSKGLRETTLTDTLGVGNHEQSSSDLESANSEAVKNSDNSNCQTKLTNQADGAQNDQSHPVSNSHEGANNSDTDVDRDPPLLEFLLENRNKLFQCPHCKIVFLDRTLHCLHMGLHNVNNPWQCNMCGKAFDNVHQFSSHVLHF